MDFSPYSEIAGDIEVVLNVKGGEVDPYEPIENQLVLAVGKTGRSNRLNFTGVEREQMIQLKNAFEDMAELIEEMLPEDNDPSELSEGKEKEMEAIKSIIVELGEGPVSIEEIIEEAENNGYSKEFAESAVDDLLKYGEIFRPEEGKVQII